MIRAAVRWALLAVAAVAGATERPVFLSGFDLSAGRTANTAESPEWFQHLENGAGDSDVGLVGNVACDNGSPWGCCKSGSGVTGQGNCNQNHRNGGHVGSHWSLRADPESGEAAYYSLPRDALCTGDGACSSVLGSDPMCDCCTGAALGNCAGNLPSVLQRTIGFSLRVETPPSSGQRRAFVGHVEEGGAIGCEARINNDRTLALYYAGSLLGTTTETAAILRCADDPTLGCTTGSQCPGGVCKSTCSPSDETGCYWLPGELTETVTGAGAQCDLRVRGRLSVTATVAGAGRPLIDVLVGAIRQETTTSTVTYYLDNIVLADSDRAGFGYVGFLGPAVTYDGTAASPDGTVSGSAWKKSDSTLTAAEHVNDGVDGAGPGFSPGWALDSSSLDMAAYGPNQALAFWRFQPNSGRCNATEDCPPQRDQAGVAGTCNTAPTLDRCDTPTPVIVSDLPAAETSMAITAVELVVVGRTNAVAGTKQLDLAAGLCPTSGSCQWGSASRVTLQDQGPSHVWGRVAYSTAPGGIPWTSAHVPQLGGQLKSSANYSTDGQAKTFAEALGLYVRASRLFAAPRNLRDHNIGVLACTVHQDCAPTACASLTDTSRTCGWCEGGKCIRDGKLASASRGDSTNGGTVAVYCTAGTSPKRPCSQVDFCSWDDLSIPGHFADQPPGGCGGSDAACRICAGRHGENGGFGYACTADGDCPATGECNTSTLACRNAGDTADILVPCCAGGECCTAPGGCTDPDTGTSRAQYECSGGLYAGQSCDTSCGSLGGDCYSDATCVLSCPGGVCTIGTGASPGGSLTPCSTSAQCPSGEQCRGFCAAATSTRCDTAAQCPSGACTAPGLCPTLRTQWGAYTVDDLTVDSLQVCGVGLQKTPEMVQAHVSTTLEGRDGNCFAAIGSGVCACTTDAGCGGIAGSCILGTCTCDADVDCGGGAGSCNTTRGKCVSGSPAARAACVSSSDCATGETCFARYVDAHKFCGAGTAKQAACGERQHCATTDCGGGACACWLPPPDCVDVAMGYNDEYSILGDVDPHCLGVSSGVTPCDYFTDARHSTVDVKCFRPEDCTANVSPNSTCRGIMYAGAAASMCTALYDTSTCTVRARACDEDADCGKSCTCAADGDCDGTSGSCVNGRCGKGSRSSCTSDGTCAGGQTCSTRTCSCPAAGCGIEVGGFDKAIGMCRDIVCPLGHCGCTTGADCGTGGVCCTTSGGCLNGTVPQYTCQAGDAARIACEKESDCASGQHCQGGSRDIGGLCHAPCTTDTQCSGTYGGTCSKWCVTGTAVGTPCTSNGDCPGSGTCGTDLACLGRCTVPSDAFACTRDEDCRARGVVDTGAGYWDLPEGLGTGIPHRFDGTCCLTTGGCGRTCVAPTASVGEPCTTDVDCDTSPPGNGDCGDNGITYGHCTCTGLPSGCTNPDGITPPVNYCPAQTRQWNADLSHRYTYWLHEFERRIRARNQSLLPALHVATIPESPMGACVRGFTEGDYLAHESERLAREFPFVAYAREAVGAYPPGMTHASETDVHQNAFGGQLWGHAVRDLHATLDTCVTGTGSTVAPEYYCLGPDAATYKTCSVPTDCAPSGGLCSGGYCLCTDAAQCPAAHTCTIRLCAGAGDCPASTDTCRVGS